MNSSLAYRRAEEIQAKAVFQLVQETVQTVYPHYYRDEIVDFFCQLHSLKNISDDIRQGYVYTLSLNHVLIGTGSLRQAHITRVYVSPAFRGKGYGRAIMEHLEREIRRNFPAARLDASLPASRFYEQCGYHTVRHEQYPVENNVILVYEIMEKDLQ